MRGSSLLYSCMHDLIHKYFEWIQLGNHNKSIAYQFYTYKNKVCLISQILQGTCVSVFSSVAD